MAESLVLSCERNRLVLQGGLATPDLRLPIEKIRRLIEEFDYKSVILDFGLCSFTHPPPMIALICQILKYQNMGVEFRLVLPNNLSTRNLFLNSNWASLIDPENFSKNTISFGRHNPATRFSTFEEQSSLINRVMDTILATVTGFSRSHLKAIEWSLNEVTDNVLVHSQSGIGGIIQVTALKSKKTVEFVVGDCGIGIAKSLRSSHGELSSDVAALSCAIEEGFTRDKEIGQGNGLYGTYKIAVEGSGSFCIASNSATLYYAESRGMHSKHEKIPILGAVVACGINYTNPLILDRALRFDGRPHEPIDLVELKYEISSDDSVIFNMIQEAGSVGSRISGAPIRTKLVNLTNLCKGCVVVDFSGVHVISSSFADEVFGKMFILLGALRYQDKIRIINADRIVKKLIEKAIGQRLALGAGPGSR